MAITVKVSELLKMANELKNDNVKYVEVSILEGEEFNGEMIPATLEFTAHDDEGGGIDYDGIEEVEID